MKYNEILSLDLNCGSLKCCSNAPLKHFASLGKMFAYLEWANTVGLSDIAQINQQELIYMIIRACYSC